MNINKVVKVWAILEVITLFLVIVGQVTELGWLLLTLAGSVIAFKDTGVFEEQPKLNLKEGQFVWIVGKRSGKVLKIEEDMVRIFPIDEDDTEIVEVTPKELLKLNPDLELKVE